MVIAANVAKTQQMRIKDGFLGVVRMGRRTQKVAMRISWFVRHCLAGFFGGGSLAKFIANIYYKRGQLAASSNILFTSHQNTHKCWCRLLIF